MSSESALRTELLLEEALETDETLLTLRDLVGGFMLDGGGKRVQIRPRPS